MREPSYNLNMNTIPFEVFCALNDMDKKYIGTKDYMGIAFFWGGHGIKHYMRDATFSQRKRVHKKFLERGLDLLGDTEEHFEIVRRVTGLR